MIRGVFWTSSVIAVLVVSGCATHEALHPTALQLTPPFPDTVTTAPQSAQFTDQTPDTSQFLELDDVDATSDSVVAAMLEQARQHYLSAIAAGENHDSTRSAGQFEEAIAILDQLSYVPDIEGNRDFNDLSKAVIEDYEQYIARIDSLSPESSIFALREKLNQATEIADSSGNGGPTQVIKSGTTIPIVINNLVEQNIHFFQGRGRSHMENWLRLAGRYFPIMKKVMREEGVPEEIVYLAMPESGLNPMARSWRKAVGMWQFIKGTGRLYGLSGNFWYDDRRDFEKATRAAARHLRDLHDEFGDWYLALAGYNSGAGRVYRGIRRSGSTDFWEMRRKLPRETRNYVPQFLAVTAIGLNPSAYGFDNIGAERPIEFERVTVDDCVDLDILARCAGTDLETMRMLNPQLVQWCTPPGVKNFELRVPFGTALRFRQNYAQIPQEQKRDWIVHTIRRGETLATIAKKYGIPSEVIQQANHLSSTRRLSIGRTVAVPVPRGSERYAELVALSAGTEPVLKSRGSVEELRASGKSRMSKALTYARQHQPADPRNKKRLMYTVKKGDTIGHIAEWYGCRAADIRNWNDLAYGRPIRAGADLAIWVDKAEVARYEKINDMTFEQKQASVPKEAEVAEESTADGSQDYTVRKGETLEKIASDHSVSISDLKRWNKLRTSRINAGQELVIHEEGHDAAPPQKSKQASPVKPAKSGEKVVIYTVKRGDTLWDIAKAYNVEPRDLKSWNTITRNKIFTGQELIIRLNESDSQQ
ncbi:MAG TPA: LysM peptidoglycan-binding domain-containing protein [Bacteroidota bacterium]|nr:LysM peptidoglycan-binding domain-containing protein [Bacteroidota bacterium]